MPHRFYLQPTIVVARKLLGAVLLSRSTEGITSGVVVETEAYCSPDDPACHACRRTPSGWETRRTARNAVMFGPAGHAYVYFTYGNHYCLNAVTQTEGTPEAVLIRALEPLEGIELMQRRRGVQEWRALTSGPGKLTKALGIDLSQNGADLTQGALMFLRGWQIKDKEVIPATRIGVREGSDHLWRFYLDGNRWVSRK